MLRTSLWLATVILITGLGREATMLVAAITPVPILEEHNAVSSPVPLGGTITINAHLVDPQGDIIATGPNQPLLSYSSSTGNINMRLSPISGTLRDGIWQGSAQILSNTTMFGDYSLTSFMAADNAGNQSTVIFNYPPGARPIEFTVAGGVPDTTSPVFQSLSVSSQSVFTTQQIIFTAHIVDPDDGLSTTSPPSISYNGPRGLWQPYNPFSLISGTTQDGIWQTIGSNLDIGMYTVNVVSASDTNRNITQLSPPDPIAAAGAFTVVDQPDKTPPVFQSLSVSPTTISAGGTVVVTTRITDDLSGVSTRMVAPRVLFDDPNFNSLASNFALVSGTAFDGIWQARITIPLDPYYEHPSPFTFVVAELSAADDAGNFALIRGATPPAAGVSFSVIHYAPTIIGVEAAIGPASGGTPITITGTNFTAGASVSFDGVPAVSVTVVNTTTITALTPSHASGKATVIVTDTDGLAGAMSNAFAFVAASPDPRSVPTAPSPAPPPNPQGRPPPSWVTGGPPPNALPPPR